MIYPTLTIALTILAAYSLLLLECFLPSGGILAVASVLCLLAAVALGFSTNLTTGLMVVLVIVIGTPILIRLLVTLWPKTRIGKQILNRSVVASKNISDGEREELTGVRGVAVPDLRPNGIALIRGQQRDVITEGEFVASGRPILVTRYEMGRLHVQERIENPAESTPVSTLEQPIDFALGRDQEEFKD